MQQRIVLTAFGFDYIRTKALIEGGGGGGVVLINFFCLECGAFSIAVLNQGRDPLEYVW